MKKIALNAIETGAENHGVTNQVETYTFLVEDHIKINKVLDLMKAAAKAYCLTEEGKRTYDGNCCCFNIGDFFTYVPNNILHQYGIYLVASDFETISLDFDTQLVEEDEIFQKEYTWNEIYIRADGKACGEPELKAKDEARSQVREFAIEHGYEDLENADCPEDMVSNYCNMFRIMFEEDGNIVNFNENVDTVFPKE